MKIDGNELAILQDQLYREGRDEEGWKVKQEFDHTVKPLFETLFGDK